MDNSEKWFAAWEAYYKGGSTITLFMSGSKVYSVEPGTPPEQVHDMIISELNANDSRHLYLIKSFNRV